MDKPHRSNWKENSFCILITNESKTLKAIENEIRMLYLSESFFSSLENKAFSQYNLHRPYQTVYKIFTISSSKDQSKY